jgi:hypothetical protein
VLIERRFDILLQNDNRVDTVLRIGDVVGTSEESKDVLEDADGGVEGARYSCSLIFGGII